MLSASVLACNTARNSLTSSILSVQIVDLLFSFGYKKYLPVEGQSPIILQYSTLFFSLPFAAFQQSLVVAFFLYPFALVLIQGFFF